MYLRQTRLVATSLTAAGLASAMLTTMPSAHAAPKAVPAPVVACAEGYATEAGSCATPIAAPPLTAAQIAQLAAKDAAVAALAERTNQPASSGGTVTPQSTIDAPGGSIPDVYKLPEVANMDIYREGEGNGKKHNTCGPAATRNMVAAMYKNRDGAYKDFGEHQFELWEGTTADGTARANVAATLNAHFSAFGSWQSLRPDDKTAYINYVMTDTHSYHQSVIANVDTEYLSFYNGHVLDHFNFVYGYDKTIATKRYLYIAEEWDPVYTYGHTFDYGNPYGFHKELLGSAFDAVDHTAIHGIVA